MSVIAAITTIAFTTVNISSIQNLRFRNITCIVFTKLAFFYLCIFPFLRYKDS